MWDFGRVVAGSPELMELFEGPSKEIHERLLASNEPAAEDFLKSLDELVYRFGGRAPNEWDLRADSWETKPALVLLAINAMARSGEEMNPYTLNERHRDHRVALTAELAEQMDEETRGTFLAACAAAVRFMPWRERGKTACVRLSNEMRVALFEVGHRMVERGILSDHHDITLLLNSELDDFVANPEPYKETLAQRRIDYLALFDLEPPFFLTEPLPLSQWPKRSAATPRRQLGTGESIQGTPGSPGVARGIARIVNDPFELGDFGPGDVLVAPSTDPAWTPLFVPAAAVVVNVGALITHAVIISRELGLPCVVSAVDADVPDPGRRHGRGRRQHGCRDRPLVDRLRVPGRRRHRRRRHGHHRPSRPAQHAPPAGARRDGAAVAGPRGARRRRGGGAPRQPVRCSAPAAT